MTISKNTYFIRARLFPALLTSIPILFFANKTLAVKYADALTNIYTILPEIAHLVLSAALIFLLVQINRLVAKEVFQRFYFKDELYMPSTNYLLQNSTFYPLQIKNNIRSKIKEKFQIDLVDVESENTDENNARRIITMAVSQIRNSLRGNTMLLQHNIEYGFWRNLIGGSLVALIISIIILIYGCTQHLSSHRSVGLICSIIYLLPVVFSSVIIRYYGKYYAKILYEQFLSLE
jgi:hypothetical protein